MRRKSWRTGWRRPRQRRGHLSRRLPRRLRPAAPRCWRACGSSCCCRPRLAVLWRVAAGCERHWRRQGRAPWRRTAGRWSQGLRANPGLAQGPRLWGKTAGLCKAPTSEGIPVLAHVDDLPAEQCVLQDPDGLLRMSGARQLHEAIALARQPLGTDRPVEGFQRHSLCPHDLHNRAEVFQQVLRGRLGREVADVEAGSRTTQRRQRPTAQGRLAGQGRRRQANQRRGGWHTRGSCWRWPSRGWCCCLSDRDCSGLGSASKGGLAPRLHEALRGVPHNPSGRPEPGPFARPFLQDVHGGGAGTPVPIQLLRRGPNGRRPLLHGEVLCPQHARALPGPPLESEA
mmetsp:Transcript_15655/g.49503  ORF Transcript_15655/g.49503 Transcript_15655/m.49503 type:complete len:342 (+) Transcript_15655:992-2017(+)